jgi:exodeoxyribonuclease V beta subunit
VRAAPSPARQIARPALLGGLPGGVEVGAFVHRVLQELDFALPRLDLELRRRIESTPGKERFGAAQRDLLADGLAEALVTPLGPLFGELALAEVARRDRLDELEFELPLAGGELPTGELSLDDVAVVLEAHLGPDDPLSGYPARLRDPAIGGVFRGYLTGSIDLVVRQQGGFVVADYKTNRLAGEGVVLTAWHYRPEALAEAMMAAHYPLQALLYAVAMHRYLRWRVRGYDPTVHLRGVAYLFLRGMLGADPPRVEGQPCGVFAWALPEGLVEELSDLLDRGRAAAGSGLPRPPARR